MAVACLIDGSVAVGVASVVQGEIKQLSVEHPTGEFTVELRLGNDRSVSCGLMRTARLLLDGAVCVPRMLWPDNQGS
ncbi:4-oxalomesaconate tautomerase [compost metagenome]